VKAGTALLVAFSVALAGCATEPEKPAPLAKPSPPPPPIAEPPPAPQAPRPAALPEPKPVAKPAAPKTPAAITLNSTELFEFNKATLTPEARARLDKEVVGRAKDLAAISVVHIAGHADRIGSAPYNKRLSERRAAAVQAYLVSKGFDRTKMESVGSGSANPVKSCDQRERKALIECLAPNRRVVVELKGTPR
jgi:OOP family OmpA-OmpF porin